MNSPERNSGWRDDISDPEGLLEQHHHATPGALYRLLAHAQQTVDVLRLDPKHDNDLLQRWETVLVIVDEHLRQDAANLKAQLDAERTAMLAEYDRMMAGLRDDELAREQHVQDYYESQKNDREPPLAE
jgi:hypothetical protein